MRVQLHGGPWHGRSIEIQNGMGHFHIKGQLPERREWREELGEFPEPVPTRVGTYSAVLYSQGDFEWDGWQTSKDHP